MKCQRCKEREANVQIMQQISGKKPQTFYLCDVCARELGISIPSIPKTSKYATNPFTAMSSIFNTDFGLGDQMVGLSETDTCDQCGLTFDEFKKTGFLGCAHCYDAFSVKMDPVFLRTQMGKEHVGRRLRRASDEISSQKTGAGTRKRKTRTVNPEESPEKDLASGSIAAPAASDALDPDSEELAALERKHIESLIKENTEKMNEAVKVEDYRMAAQLRDEIAALTKQRDGEQV